MVNVVRMQRRLRIAAVEVVVPIEIGVGVVLIEDHQRGLTGNLLRRASGAVGTRCISPSVFLLGLTPQAS